MIEIRSTTVTIVVDQLSLTPICSTTLACGSVVDQILVRDNWSTTLDCGGTDTPHVYVKYLDGPPSHCGTCFETDQKWLKAKNYSSRKISQGWIWLIIIVAFNEPQNEGLNCFVLISLQTCFVICLHLYVWRPGTGARALRHSWAV